MFFRSILLSTAIILMTAASSIADPQDAVDVLRDQSCALMSKGKFAEALLPNDKALKICPESESATVWFERGLILQNLKRNDESLQCYNKAISLQAHPEFLLSKGNVLAAMGNLSEASDCYTAAIKTDPTNVRLYVCRAAAEITLKQNEQAAQDLSKALQLDPKCESALVNRGTLEMHQKEYQKAQSDFDKAIQINPKDGVAHNQKALIFWALKDKPKALIEAETATRLDTRFRPDFEWMKKADVSQSLTTESRVKTDGYVPVKK